MATKTLGELAKTVRSKNAGTDRITFDVIFQQKETYELVRDSKVLSRQSVAKIFNIDESRVTDFVDYDAAFAIKFTIKRTRPSGSPGESDIFGCQQYPPLLSVEVPV